MISQTEFSEYYKSYENYCRRADSDYFVPYSDFSEYLKTNIYIDKMLRGVRGIREDDMDRFIPKINRVQLNFGETGEISLNGFVKSNIQRASRIMESPFVYFVHQQGYRMTDVFLNRLYNDKVTHNSLMYVTVEFSDQCYAFDMLNKIAKGKGYIKTSESTAVCFRDLQTGRRNVIVSEKPFVFPCEMIKEIKVTESGIGTSVKITDEEPCVPLESTRRLMKILKGSV